MLVKLMRVPALAASLLAASAPALADYMMDILPPASPMAQDAYNLHWGILWVCVVIFFLVFGVMFWSRCSFLSLSLKVKLNESGGVPSATARNR